MKVVCPSCGEFIPGADIDISRSLAVCRPCSDIVPLPAIVHEDEDGGVVHEGSAMILSQRIASIPLWAYRPVNWNYAEDRRGGTITIRLKEPRGTAWFVLFLALLWNAALYLWIQFVISTDGSIFGVFRYIMPLFHCGVGLYFLFGALRMLINTTVCTFGRGMFHVRGSPLPLGIGVINEPLKGLRCFVDNHNVVTQIPDRWFRQRMVYSVNALTTDQRNISLELFLTELPQAKYLALRLNRALDEIQAAKPRPPTKIL